ncbi:MAG: branched-chain amino acid ABC transporter permease [Burkholderiaceae bacterium]|nr:branched-chain amino acid ABC transporter permease [Burkholderiaceae bacterium]
MKPTLSPLDKISIVIIAFLAIVPFQGIVYDLFMMKVFCFAIFAASLNLLLGYAGLLSFGHAAFFGTGAYITAYVMKEWGFTPELGPRGKFLGLIDLSTSTPMYYFALVVFVIAFFLIKRIVSSPFGQVLKSIRENEPRAISLGYDVNRYKLIAFTLSAGLAGLGGGLKSLVLQLASLSDVFWHTSGEAVLMTILGGIGTLWGPVAGAAVIINLQNYLANLGGWSTITTGAIFVVCVLAFRRGIIGEIAYRLKIKL